MEPKLDSKKTCTIYLVRHGETDWNAQNIIQGTKGLALNKKGLRQAMEAAKRLKQIKFDVAYSSDLVRAKKTTEIIALEHKISVTTNQALRERTYGEFEGKSEKYLREKLADLLKKFNKLSYEKKASYQFPFGIESINSCVSRLVPFLKEISITHLNQTILVGTHSDMIRYFLIHIGFATETELTDGSISNTAHVKVLSDGIDFFVTETWGVNKNES